MITPEESGRAVSKFIEERDQAREENGRLKKIIAGQLSENDELGREFIHVSILKDENARLREALEFYAEEKNYLNQPEQGGPCRLFSPMDEDHGKRAREALGLEDKNG